MAENIESGGFLFYSNFDSGNLARVEWVPKTESSVISINKNGKDVPEIPDIEFNVWTKPDCMGTEFENANRSWFYFGVKGYLPCVLMKLNLVDLNRQAKMYSQGMAPVYKTVPGRPNWERIRDRPTYDVVDNIFTLSFKFKTPENIDTIMYFAFTYPYTYTELQATLLSIDERFLTRSVSVSYDDIYYYRECVCKSLENRRIDLITISSYYNITLTRETRLKHLFPDVQVERPYTFRDKKVIFVSARVHPGETPSSFVFNGLLNFLLNREDPVACVLRRMYVFKMIPFLNPDGVVKGHYRTDTRGVNLNRMYLSPTLAEHPSIYAARALIQYYHSGIDVESVIEKYLANDNNRVTQQVEVLSLEEKQGVKANKSESCLTKYNCKSCDRILTDDELANLKLRISNQFLCSECSVSKLESGLYMYLDMHGHASKKGIFIYGNHFPGVENNVECMLFPKIMSLNNHNFHFTACNFTERNMYLKDRRDGMSREGSGRVAVLKLTGLIQSYTLECNYNSGRMVNVLPPSIKEGSNKTMHTLPLPPKYTPHIFEEVGRALGASILDLSGNNPNSRIPNSEFHSLNGIREWLRMNCMSEIGFGQTSRRKVQAAQNQKEGKEIKVKKRSKNIRATPTHTKNASKVIRSKSAKILSGKTRSSKMNIKKSGVKTAPIPIERKENMMALGSRDPNLTSQSSCSYSSSPSCSRMFNRSASKSKGLSIRGRTKRDKNTRSNRKLLNQDTSKVSSRSVQTSTTSIGSLQKLKSDSGVTTNKESLKRIKVAAENTSDRLKLREICFVKHNQTKKLIAKFSSTDSNNQETHDDDDDLVLAWDPSYSPKILTKQDKPSSSRQYEPSTSKQNPRPSFKNNAFVTVKARRNIGTLRRITSATLDASGGKCDKMKKKKKNKSKIL